MKTATVVSANRRVDPVEVTRSPSWGVNPDGTTWYEPGETYRRYIPGAVHIEITLDTGEVVPWDDWPPPRRVWWNGKRWLEERFTT